MAITTLDNLVVNFQPPTMFHKTISGSINTPIWHSLWGMAGVPGAGSYATTLAGSNLSKPTNGQIDFVTQAGVDNVLSFFSGTLTLSNTTGGVLLLCDRLWHNGGITITSTAAQTINATPTRVGLVGRTFLGVEVSAATGAGTPTITVIYTKNGNTTTSTNHVPTIANAPAGSFFPINNNLSQLFTDGNLQTITSITLSATWTSGTINLVAYSVLAMLDIRSSNRAEAVDFINGAGTLIDDAAVPFLIYIPRASNSVASSHRFIGTLSTATLA